MRTCRLSSLAVLSLALFGLLALMPSPAGQLVTQPSNVLTWWARAGTTAAAMSIIQLVAMGLCLYLFAVSSGALLMHAVGATTRTARLLGALPASLRTFVGAGIIVSAVSLPMTAGAQEAPSAVEPIAVSEPISGRDIGPVEFAPAITVQDIGRAAGPPPPPTPPATATATATATTAEPPEAEPQPSQWIVGPGDHLWGIAETVMAQAKPNSTLAEVADYWTMLIDANRSTVADPDLIYPGQELMIPNPTRAGS